MDKSVKEKLERKARSLGFDSAQAYIRFWVKSVVDGRKVDLGEGSWDEPSPQALARLDRLAKEAKKDSVADKLKSYANTTEFMESLTHKRETDKTK
jgi:hypothetical protein